MNLFVVSTVGQVHTAQAVVLKKDLKENILVVLYTSVNMNTYDNIINNIRKKCFSEIVKLELPLQPNAYSKKKQFKIRKSYEDLFNKYVINATFVANVNNHYSYICDIAKSNGSEINLYEEGAGTYKVLLNETNEIETKSQEEQFKELKRVVIDRLKKIVKDSFLVEKFIPFLRRLAIVRLLALLKNIIKEVIVIIVGRERILKYKMSKVPEKLRPFYNEWTEFDNAYLVFAEIAKNSDKYSFKNIEPLVVDYKLTDELKEILDTDYIIKTIDEDSVVFVDQLYGGNVKTVVSETLDILYRNFQGKKIFIKMHPKSPYSRWKEFRTQMQEYEYAQFFILKFAQSFPVEILLEEKKFNTLVGISSTSLLYAKDYHKGVNIYSIAKNLNDLVPKMHDNLIEDYELITRIIDVIDI